MWPQHGLSPYFFPSPYAYTVTHIHICIPRYTLILTNIKLTHTLTYGTQVDTKHFNLMVFEPSAMTPEHP
jgi:hypothetical protein